MIPILAIAAVTAEAVAAIEAFTSGAVLATSLYVASRTNKATGRRVKLKSTAKSKK